MFLSYELIIISRSPKVNKSDEKVIIHSKLLRDCMSLEPIIPADKKAANFLNNFIFIIFSFISKIKGVKINNSNSASLAYKKLNSILNIFCNLLRSFFTSEHRIYFIIYNRINIIFNFHVNFVSIIDQIS